MAQWASDDGRARLYCGDCMEVMRGMGDGEIDAIVTDPPYGIGYRNRRGQGIRNDDRPFIWWLREGWRVLKDGGALVCFCRWDVQEAFRWAIDLAGFRVRSQVIWDRDVHGMGDTKAMFAPQHDVIWFATKGRFAFPGRRPCSVLRHRRIMRDMVHPTQKPVDLMAALVEAVTAVDDVVFDPFAGSGSTGDAALATGRRFVGAEIGEDHYGTAVERLAAVMV